jgi:hypothetical protein
VSLLKLAGGVNRKFARSRRRIALDATVQIIERSDCICHRCRGLRWVQQINTNRSEFTRRNETARQYAAGPHLRAFR